jgi:hypothetical protein
MRFFVGAAYSRELLPRSTASVALLLVPFPQWMQKSSRL